MASSETVGPSRQTKGIVLMTVAMLSIPAVDGFAKTLSFEYSPLFISWARYAAASSIVLPIALARHGVHILPTERLGAHGLRTLFLVASMTLYFLAIAEVPLATAVSAFFVGPILAVVLSVFVLKERLTIWKLLSLGLGFLGALVMLRPGGAIEPGLLYAFGSGFCFAFYMIATRAASRGSSPLQTLAFQCIVGTMLLTPQAIWTWDIPALNELILFAGLGAFSAMSHLLSIAAFRHADASTLAPLVYLELIGTSLIGFFLFQEVPGWATLIGAALIVAGGLVLLKRSS
jgi:drug/metabolite transporter (DMT)-like permease